MMSSATECMHYPYRVFKPRDSLILICLISFLQADISVAGETASTMPDQSLQSFALLVSSAVPGKGQEELKYPDADAGRLAQVLEELGGYRPENVKHLSNPSAVEVMDQIKKISKKLQALSLQDEKSIFLFYYSGHARASDLDLGGDRISLATLKQKLISMPATVKLVILDACQSGAISNIKGAKPAKSFSYNFVSGLNTKGTVVMASSTANELSQESDDIGGSFFTNHLVSGLRGAADSNGDGRVTLSEAYSYAYNRTLISTASTAVGSQHVTLQTDLRGKGDMVLSYPSRASSRLELPAAMKGDLLVYSRPSGMVVAEVFKAEGGLVRIALVPGKYSAILKQDNHAKKCSFKLDANQTKTLETNHCEPVEEAKTTIKAAALGRPDPVFSMELAFGGTLGRTDKYTDRLETFGYEAQLFSGNNIYLQASLLYHLSRNLALDLTYSTLDQGDYKRMINSQSGNNEESRFDWTAHRISLEARASLPLLDYWLTPYIQAGGGMTIVKSHMSVENGENDIQYHYGYNISVSAGLSTMFWQHFGMFVQGGYVFAPALKNLVGDTHDDGGFTFSIGVRGAI
ncbi:MAG: caspase family protein [Deltaproteobacteria bacterium]|nr:caspase family protein [Deltaproteobacteria bacterium]